MAVALLVNKFHIVSQAGEEEPGRWGESKIETRMVEMEKKTLNNNTPERRWRI